MERYGFLERRHPYEYSEYKSYKSRLSQAKAYADSLPSEIIMPEIPKDDEDNQSIDSGDYYDQEVDDLHKAEQELEEYNKKLNIRGYLR